MLKYYQELLNECIDLSEHKKKHKEMKSTLNKIKTESIYLNIFYESSIFQFGC